MQYVTVQDIQGIAETLAPFFIFMMVASSIVFLQLFNSIFMRIWDFFDRPKKK